MPSYLLHHHALELKLFIVQYTDHKQGTHHGSSYMVTHNDTPWQQLNGHTQRHIVAAVTWSHTGDTS